MRKVPKHQPWAKPPWRGDAGNRREIQSPTRAPRFLRARIRKEISLIFYINAIKSYHFNFPKFFPSLHNHESSIKYSRAPAPIFNYLHSAIRVWPIISYPSCLKDWDLTPCLTGHLPHQLLGQLPLNTIPICSLPFLHNSKSGFPYHHPRLNTSSDLHPHPHILSAFPSFRYTVNFLSSTEVMLILFHLLDKPCLFYYPIGPSNSYSKTAPLPVQ